MTEKDKTTKEKGLNVKITSNNDGNHFISKVNHNGDHTAGILFSDYEIRVLQERLNNLNIPNLNIGKNDSSIKNDKIEDLIQYIKRNSVELNGFKAVLIGNITDLIDLAVGEKLDWSGLNN